MLNQLEGDGQDCRRRGEFQHGVNVCLADPQLFLPQRIGVYSCKTWADKANGAAIIKPWARSLGRVSPAFYRILDIMLCKGAWVARGLFSTQFPAGEHPRSPSVFFIRLSCESCFPIFLFKPRFRRTDVATISELTHGRAARGCEATLLLKARGLLLCCGIRTG